MKPQLSARPDSRVVTPASHLLPTGDVTPIQLGILQAVSYADVFDYPLTEEEIHRYLVGVPASRSEVRAALDGPHLIPRTIECHDGFYTLPGRSALVETRRRRSAAAARIWRRAERYGRLIARLPFVRMVAVTGALAVGNAEPDDDIDYLIVTVPGRLWLCRAFVILLVRIAAGRGDEICPNYFLAEEALALPERDLFTAHELVQMVPIAGQATYERMMRLNGWTQALLPNANGSRRPDALPRRGLLKALLEATLSTPPGGWLERWEMRRKIARFNRQMEQMSQSQDGQSPVREVVFNSAQCKGHFSRHGERTLKAYNAYLEQLGKDGRHDA